MSHHLDSPSSRQDSRLNITDIYVFAGQTGTVLVMNVNSAANGTPGFHPEARYEFKIHFDGEQYESVTYRLSFGTTDGAGPQAITVAQLTDSDARDDAASGTPIADGRTGEVVEGSGGNGVRIWAGFAAEPFYIDLDQLRFIIRSLQSKTPITFEGWSPDKAANSFNGAGTQAIVLEVPGTDARLRSGRDIGVWGVTKLAADGGGWRQINRAAIPMVWPLLRAMGDSDESPEYQTDTTSHPSTDRANDGARIADMITAATRNTGTANPGAYGEAVTNRLLPDLLPYRVGTAATFGFGGFNGRTLADNAPEVMYSLLTNTGFSSGLTSAVAAETRSDEFPYVVPSARI